MRGKNYRLFPFDFVNEALTKIANSNEKKPAKYEQLKHFSTTLVRRTAWKELEHLDFKYIPLTDPELQYLTVELDNPI